MTDAGKLIVIMGPMFAGKTTMLINELEKAKRSGKSAIVFKAEIDTRDGPSEVVSHDGIRIPASVVPTDKAGIAAIKKASENYEVIAVEEGQFWNGAVELAAALDELAYKSKTVYVSMLNKGMYGEAFNIGKELIPIADKVYSLEAICTKCGGRASFTQRTAPVKPNATLADMVGGAESYQPRCRKCFEMPQRPKSRTLYIRRRNSGAKVQQAARPGH